MILFLTFRFEPADSFIGYQEDTPASVVFKTSKYFEHSTDKSWYLNVRFDYS